MPLHTPTVRVSFPLDDPTFAEVEALAQRLGVSRSELCRAALREYLARHSSEDVTAALNRVYSANAETEDFRQEAAQRTFRANE